MMKHAAGDLFLEALRRADSSVAYNDLTHFYARKLRDLKESGRVPRVLLVNVDEGGDRVNLVTDPASEGAEAISLGQEDIRCFTPLAAGCPASFDRYRNCQIFISRDRKDTLDLAVCCHSISYLPHNVASCLLANLRDSLRIGGHLFISALGLHSSLADRYPAADETVDRRFAALEEEGAGVPAGKLCLYSERDLFLTLANVGWGVVRTSTSSEGNALAIAVRI